jgi:hypothetical protein
MKNLINKNSAIKIAIAIILLAIIYIGIWFFQASKIEQIANQYLKNHSETINAESVSVSGFPLRKKLEIVNLKVSLTNKFNKKDLLQQEKHYILIKKIDAISGVFSSDFEVAFDEDITLVESINAKDNAIFSISFNAVPKASFKVDQGYITNFEYQDQGFKIKDSIKNDALEAKSNNIKITVAKEEEKDRVKITLNSSSINAPLFSKIFKENIITSFIGNENNIINLKNIGPVATADILNTPAGEAVKADTLAVKENNVTVAQDQQAFISPANNLGNVAGSGNRNIDDMAKITQEINQVPLESSLIIDLDLELANSKEVMLPVPPVANSNDSKANDKANDSAKAHKVIINKMELKNSQFTFNLNGQVQLASDDTKPFGSVTLKLENFSNVKNIVANIFGIASNQNSQSNIFQESAPIKPDSANPNSVNPDSLNPQQNIESKIATSPEAIKTNTATEEPKTLADPQVENPIFTAISILFAAIEENAKKNPLTHENLLVFDITREKNIEFIINETPTREILGKINSETEGGETEESKPLDSKNSELIDPNATNQNLPESPAVVPAVDNGANKEVQNKIEQAPKAEETSVPAKTSQTNNGAKKAVTAKPLEKKSKENNQKKPN